MIPLESFTRPPNAQRTDTPAAEAETAPMESENASADATAEFAHVMADASATADQTPLAAPAQHAESLPALQKTVPTTEQPAKPTPPTEGRGILIELGETPTIEEQMVTEDDAYLSAMPANSTRIADGSGTPNAVHTQITQGEHGKASIAKQESPTFPPSPATAATYKAGDTSRMAKTAAQISTDVQSATSGLPPRSRTDNLVSPAEDLTKAETRLRAETITTVQTSQNTLAPAPKPAAGYHPMFSDRGTKATTLLALQAEQPALAAHIADAEILSQPTASAPKPLLPATGDARSVVLQVAAQIVKVDTGTLDIRLDPQELGRVSITLSAGDESVSAVVAAERSETHDLLRRHADMLQRALRDAGYADVTLNFSDTAAEQQNENSTFQPKSGGASAEPTAPEATARSMNLSLYGLDIRL